MSTYSEPEKALLRSFVTEHLGDARRAMGDVAESPEAALAHDILAFLEEYLIHQVEGTAPEGGWDTDLREAPG